MRARFRSQDRKRLVRLSLRHARPVERLNLTVNLRKQTEDIEQLEIDARYVLENKQP